MIARRTLLAAALAAPVAAEMPTGAEAQAFKARNLRFAGAGGIELAGTLLLPADSAARKVPGVVLIAGSGPTDRDGNNPLLPVKVDLLKEIAEVLEGAGIASLRYDKRGIGASAIHRRNAEDRQESYFTWDQFVSDVQAAHAELVRHDEIKAYATALLGHSEGGLLAIAATAAMGKKRPYALVLASTPGRPLGDIVREQIARSMPSLSATAERIMSAIRTTGQVPPDGPPAFRAVFPGYAGAFLKAAFAFDPATTLARTDIPCLLLQGGADIQVVPPHDVQPLLDTLARRNAPGEALIAPMVSHNLKIVSGPGDPGFAGPIAPAIEIKLVGWLRRLLGAPSSF